MPVPNEWQLFIFSVGGIYLNILIPYSIVVCKTHDAILIKCVSHWNSYYIHEHCGAWLRWWGVGVGVWFCIARLHGRRLYYRVAEMRFFADVVLLLLMVPVWVVPGGVWPLCAVLFRRASLCFTCTTYTYKSCLKWLAAYRNGWCTWYLTPRAARCCNSLSVRGFPSSSMPSSMLYSDLHLDVAWSYHTGSMQLHENKLT